MKQLLFGCSYTDVWVSPADWKTTTSKKSLQKLWYVQCYFYDPQFKEEYPNGFPYRVRLNRYKTLEDRRAAALDLMEQIPDLLETKGFNPITGKFMIVEPEPEPEPVEWGPQSDFIEIMRFVQEKLPISKSSKDDIRYIINALEKICAQQRLSYKISEVGRKQLKALFDYVPGMTANKYNKYITYLSIVYNELVEMEAADHNPVTTIKKRKVTKRIRRVLSLDERRRMNAHLLENHPSFWLFVNVYFHSGGRLEELLRLKAKDVNLKTLTYRTVIQKGKMYREVDRPIKKISLDFWIEALEDATSEMHLFSVGLKPGMQKIRRDQITRRWKMHVKEPLGIMGDISSLKHSNLTEISAKVSAKTAAKAAGHTTTAMVDRHYDVGRVDRETRAVQNMQNELAPENYAALQGGVCRPMAFTFKN